MSDKEYVEVIQKMFNHKPTTNFILAGPKTLEQLRGQINEEIKRINNFKTPGVYNQIHEPYIYEYDKIDSETIEKVALETFPKIDPYHGLGKPFSITFNEPWVPKEKELIKIPGLTWIDKIEKDFIEDFKQGMIDTILMGDYKKEMKMKMKINRVELEMQRLRESTGENYMLNKMVNTDGVNFFAEYTLYKDYNKYFGLTLDGESLNVIYIMEEEFAEFLSHYRLSAIYPQVEAVHEDTWNITPEENEAIKEQMESGQTDKFTPVYGDYDIDKQLVVDSDLDIDKPNIVQSMWTETSTNTGKDYAKPWIETSINTNPDCVKPWGGYYSSGSGTIPVASGSGTILVGSGAISVAPETFYIDEKQLKGLSTTQHLKTTQDGHILINDTESKSDQEKLAESVKFIESLLAQEKQVEIKDSPTTLKNTENKSGAELITKVISDIIKELFTGGTCSINITLKQD